MVDGPRFLSAPYEWLVAPYLTWLLGGIVALCVIAIVFDLATSTPPSGRGRLASLCLALLLLIVGRGWFPFDSWAATALVLSGLAVLVAHGAHFGWSATDVSEAAASRWWPGLLIIATAFALKCHQLDDWPPNLNTYSAMTGEEGLRALAGEWPERFFGVRAYPLAEGGKSPLHLPILWAAMKIFGGTVFSVRFAEVLASTALLAVFWVWLRGALPRPWAALALAVFAFSPWHLAQSRFGTFFSLSAALALSMLCLGERSARDGPRVWAAWVALGLCAGAIGWLYAPLQVLYAFFAVLLLAGALRPGRRLEPLAAVAGFAVVVGVQLVQSGPEAFMRSDFGQLATDTVIWRKTADDVVTREIQAPAVIADHFARNIDRWFREIFRDGTILVWYAPALAIGLLYALSDVLRGSTWVRGAYFLIGVLPPLLIFPLHRRSLVLWPLVYVAAVRFGRELVVAAAATRWPRWPRRLAAAAVAGIIVASSMHGLRLFAVANTAALVYPYFGPPHQYMMIDEAERLLPYYRLLFVNPATMKHTVAIGLYEPARATRRPQPYELIEIRQGERQLERFLRDNEKSCFIYLNDEEHTWVTDTLAAGLPAGRLIQRRRAPGEPALYSLYFVPAE